MSDQPFLPYGRQSIDQSDRDAVLSALSQELITRGPQVSAFEQAIAEYCGVDHAIAYSNGSTALRAAYAVADIGPHDRVITTPNTFVATVTGAMASGAQPVFLDLDPATGNFSLEDLEATLQETSSRGKTFVTPVHFAGVPVDMEALDELITNPNYIVIEDAAHALGSKYSNEFA